MSVDTNGDEEGEAVPEPRSLRWGEWVTTSRFAIGGVLVLLGVLVVSWTLTVVEGSSASNEVLWGLTEGRALLVGVAVVVVGTIVALSGYRLTTRQQQYLDRAEREQLEIRDYLAFLEGVTAERTGVLDAAVTEGSSAGEQPSDGERTGRPMGLEPWWELRSRLEHAETTLEKARQSVYRRDYVNFLSLYYEASRQSILLYDLLDRRTHGWTFGLADLEPESNEVAVSDRRRNLSRRIRSFARGSLPESRLKLVEEYLDGLDGPQTPLNLLSAVRELHEWNVSRYERATQIRRFLRGGVLVMVVLLVGLAVVLTLGFGGAFLEATSSDTTTGTALSNDWFLGLIVLVGALGAVFSMVYRSFGEFYTLTTDPSIPQPVFMLEALLARTLFGSVSALFLFLVARTEFAGVVFAEGLLTSPLALLVLGFVAGFSERLVDEAVGKIAADVAAPEEEPSDEGGPVPDADEDGEVDGAGGDEGGGDDEDGRDGGDDEDDEDDAGQEDRPPGSS